MIQGYIALLNIAGTRIKRILATMFIVAALIGVIYAFYLWGAILLPYVGYILAGSLFIVILLGIVFSIYDKVSEYID